MNTSRLSQEEDISYLVLNRQPFCILCPDEHERVCRCSHVHHVHNFSGGCVECWQEYLSGKRQREKVCDCYDQRKVVKV